MKKILLVLFACCSFGAYANSGDITVNNTNTQFDNQDSISIQIVPTSSTGVNSFYAKDLAPNGTKTLTGDDFGAIKKYDVYVADSSQSGVYRRCLKDIEYSEDENPIVIAVTNTDLKPAYNQCGCNYQGTVHQCEFPLTSYKQVRGSASIPW